jgi:hypothetical protein
MLTLNNLPVVSGCLTWPLVGRWTFSGELSADKTLATGAKAELVWQTDKPIKIASGSVVRSSLRSGELRLFVCGGLSLAQPLKPAHFRKVTARTVVADTLAAAGATLAKTSARSVLDTSLEFWTRPGISASEALSQLCDATGANWRVLPDGTVWIGTETWPEVKLEGQDLDDNGELGTLLYALDVPSLTAGVTFRKNKITRVEHSVGREESWRTTAWL